MELRPAQTGTKLVSTPGTFDCNNFADQKRPIITIAFKNTGKSTLIIKDEARVPPGEVFTVDQTNGYYDTTKYQYSFIGEPATSQAIIIYVSAII